MIKRPFPNSSSSLFREHICKILRTLVRQQTPQSIRVSYIISHLSETLNLEYRRAFNYWFRLSRNLFGKCRQLRVEEMDTWDGDGSSSPPRKNYLKYEPEACYKCPERIDCLVNPPRWKEVLK